LDDSAREGEGHQRLHRYLSSIGLKGEYAQHGDDPKLMGSKGPNVLSTTIRARDGKPEGPHRQQLVHEAAHAQQTPAVSTVKEYQSKLGAPGDRAAAKQNGLGGNEEAKAHYAEAGISRRAGLPPFKDPQPRVKPNAHGTQMEQAAHAAKDSQRKLDLGIHRFDPATGTKMPQTDVHAQINRRAIGEHRQAWAVLRQKYPKHVEHLESKKIAKSETRFPITSDLKNDGFEGKYSDGHHYRWHQDADHILHTTSKGKTFKVGLNETPSGAHPKEIKERHGALANYAKDLKANPLRKTGATKRNNKEVKGKFQEAVGHALGSGTRFSETAKTRARHQSRSHFQSHNVPHRAGERGWIYNRAEATRRIGPAKDKLPGGKTIADVGHDNGNGVKASDLVEKGAVKRNNKEKKHRFEAQTGRYHIARALPDESARKHGRRELVHGTPVDPLVPGRDRPSPERERIPSWVREKLRGIQQTNPKLPKGRTIADVGHDKGNGVKASDLVEKAKVDYVGRKKPKGRDAQMGNGRINRIRAERSDRHYRFHLESGVAGNPELNPNRTWVDPLRNSHSYRAGLDQMNPIRPLENKVSGSPKPKLPKGHDRSNPKAVGTNNAPNIDLGKAKQFIVSMAKGAKAKAKLEKDGAVEAEEAANKPPEAKPVAAPTPSPTPTTAAPKAPAAPSSGGILTGIQNALGGSVGGIGKPRSYDTAGSNG
jgi:hypothetical protein